MCSSGPGIKFSLVSKRNRREIHEYLFREGVIVVKKDPKLFEHPELKGIPNLHVMMVLKSLKSRNYVSEKFNWQHYYYVLSNEGIEHLRDILHLPSHVQPATYTRKARTGPPFRPADAAPREDNWRAGDNDRKFRGAGRGRPHVNNPVSTFQTDTTLKSSN
jgi:small subunit ribosomal protein S10e